MEETTKDKAHRRWLPLISAIFVTTLIISNIIAVKLVSVGGLIMPAAIFIFPISYIFGDILTEVYGYARSRRVIWIGFFCNLLAVAAIWISINLPAAPVWNLGAFESSAAAQKAYEAIFGFTPRILIASFAAYLFGEFINSFVLAKMKDSNQRQTSLDTLNRLDFARSIGRFRHFYHSGFLCDNTNYDFRTNNTHPMDYKIGLRSFGHAFYLPDCQFLEENGKRRLLRLQNKFQSAHVEGINIRMAGQNHCKVITRRLSRLLYGKLKN